MNEFTCVKCDVTKPLSDFYKSTTNKSGHRGKCKRCEAACKRKYRANNAEKIAAGLKAWREANPEYAAVYRKAYRKANPKKIATAKKGWNEANPGYFAAYYKVNAEKLAAYGKAYREANPEANRNTQLKRRALKRDNGVFKVTPKEIKRMLAQPCAYCQAPAEHIDHVVPLSRGGRHSIGNLIGSCAPCNQSKAARFLTEWKRNKVNELAVSNV